MEPKNLIEFDNLKKYKKKKSDKSDKRCCSSKHPESNSKSVSHRKSSQPKNATSEQCPPNNECPHTFITPNDYSLFSDDDTEEQCRKIFDGELFVSSSNGSKIKIKKRPVEEQGDYELSTRKRIEHASTKPDFVTTSSNMLAKQDKNVQEKPNNMSVLGNTDIKSDASTDVSDKIIQKPQNTVPKKVPNGQSGIRHISTPEVANKLTVKEPDNTKIPCHIRTITLNNMTGVCLGMYDCAELAYERARNEEYTVFVKCKTLSVYKHCARLAVNRLKTQAKQAILKGVDAPSTSSKLEPAPRQQFSESNIYSQLIKHILTPEQLWQNGYPRPHPTVRSNGAAIINVTNQISKPKRKYMKTCQRCHKNYRITKQGYPVHPEECFYHRGKKYMLKGKTRYGCCGGCSDYTGCVSAPMHVFNDVAPNKLRGFVKTMHDSCEEDNLNGDFGVYALDCEMSYTTAGLELTRITVIDRQCQVVYETFVKPFNKIIDYNTRFSGIEAKHLEGVTTTLLDVQANLLYLFNSKTILIGHSLENDLKALKLIHDTVIDTSILFPHRLGLPYKRTLKNLALTYLAKIIQNQTFGHDSAEDAITCMKLVLWKINEDSKVNCCAG